MKTIAEQNQAERLEHDVDAMRHQLTEVQARVSRMDLVPRQDVEGRLHRVETMVAALERDANEVKEEAGANLEKTRELASQVRKELTNLSREVETLSQGQKTIAGAALEVMNKAVEKSKKKRS